MEGLLVGLTSALWLGILTSISPCPLATNIAAMSFIGRRVGSSRRMFVAGLLYTAGRMLVYVVLGIIIVSSLLSISEVSIWLQEYMNKILGPLLILVGMVLLELIRLPITGGGLVSKMQNRAESYGVWGAGLLGVVFALSFCPVSAALFFGSLIPLCASKGSIALLPSVYGIGTALPVVLFATLIAFGAGSVGKAFNRLTHIERWARRVTGGVFILVGIYYCLTYIFKIL
jgi:cytochrome c-type biogenesis protein